LDATAVGTLPMSSRTVMDTLSMPPRTCDYVFFILDGISL